MIRGPTAGAGPDGISPLQGDQFSLPFFPLLSLANNQRSFPVKSPTEGRKGGYVGVTQGTFH